MFQRIITFSVGNPLIVSIGVVALIIWGVLSFQSLPIDAVPDITNNQVQIVTLSPALAPQEVERFITVPIEQTMATIDGIVERRSISRFGLSVITLVFNDNVDLYWARAQVDQRLVDAQTEIPAGMGSPTIMPITTGLGEIYQYTLEVDKQHHYSPMDLRTTHDWIVKRGLLGTQGVADIASFGGYLKQIEIAVDPSLLAASGLSMADVLEHVEKNNGNTGSAYIERGQRIAFIRTEGLVQTKSDIENIVLKNTDTGLPLLVRDVAQVRDGHAVRYGALTSGDSADAVGGIVYMLKGANSSQVINSVKSRIAEIEKTLPPGISIVPYLDRSALVHRTIATVGTNLAEGALIVVFVLVLMLGNLRAGLLVASVIPLSMLFAIGMMQVFGVSGNLMSLGALDFGLIVDGTVIIVEHVLAALSHTKWSTTTERITIVQGAALDIRRSASFGEFIILVVYTPILALQGEEGGGLGDPRPPGDRQVVVRVRHHGGEPRPARDDAEPDEVGEAAVDGGDGRAAADRHQQGHARQLVHRLHRALRAGRLGGQCQRCADARCLGRQRRRAGLGRAGAPAAPRPGQSTARAAAGPARTGSALRACRGATARRVVPGRHRARRALGGDAAGRRRPAAHPGAGRGRAAGLGPRHPERPPGPGGAPLRPAANAALASGWPRGRAGHHADRAADARPAPAEFAGPCRRGAG